MKHKHAELIHAWADGAEIQVFYNDTKTWGGVDNPNWHESLEYRIKPEGKKAVMNIIELAEQAGLAYKTPNGKYWIDAGYPDVHLERFADLVAAAEREACAEHYLGIMRDAVEQAALREREACAKVCEDLFLSDGEWCAKSIRARGEA